MSRFVTILNYIWPWSTRMRIFETKDVCVFSSISDKIRWISNRFQQMSPKSSVNVDVAVFWLHCYFWSIWPTSILREWDGANVPHAHQQSSTTIRNWGVSNWPLPPICHINRASSRPWMNLTGVANSATSGRIPSCHVCHVITMNMSEVFGILNYW